MTFRDRLSAYLYRWVLIHELGHYFGLDHAGHDGAHHIMYTAEKSECLDMITGATVPEPIFFTGEPRFSADDVFATWDWLLTAAPACAMGEE